MFRANELERIEIPYLPPLVDAADVSESNGRLIPLDQIERVKTAIAQAGNRDGRYSKKMLGTSFSVNKVGDQYYAVYKGAKLNKLVGAGGFGAVKLVQNMDDGTWAVVKTIPLKPDSQENKDKKNKKLYNKKAVAQRQPVLNREQRHNRSVHHEIENLKYAKHFLGHFQRLSNKKNVLQDEIIMVLAPGASLNHMLREKVGDKTIHRQMPAVKWLDLCSSATQAIKTLYDDGMLHRDIKPSNFIWNPIFGLYAIDFGLARAYDKNHEVKGLYAGTDRFMAPEIRKHDHKVKIYNQATEIYALGVTLAEILSLDVMGNRVEKSFAFIEKIKNPMLQDELLQLVKNMLHDNPQSRPTMDTVIQKLTELRRGELDLVSKISSLVYLDISDYAHMSEEQKSELFAALKNVDEVQLCLGPNPWAQEMLMVIRHELESHGVCVSSSAIVLTGIDAQRHYAKLKENTMQYSLQRNIICNSYYVKCAANLDPASITSLHRSIDSLELHAEHKQIAAANIDRQITRIAAKNPDDIRLQFLRKFIHDLDNGQIRTYRQLFFELRQLEQDLLANEKSSFRRSFGIASSAVLMVRQTSLEIVNDAHGRKPGAPSNRKK